MWVDALLRHEDVGPELLEDRRYDLVERAHIGEVVGVRRECDVDAVAGPLAGAALVGAAGAGEERPAEPRDHPVFVERDREHLIGVIEGGLHTVAVVCVYVDVRDLHPAVREKATNDRRIVVDAEARRAPAYCVVQPARAVERDARPTCDHLLHRHERSAGGQERCLVHAGERRSVAPRREPPRGVVEARVG